MINKEKKKKRGGGGGGGIGSFSIAWQYRFKMSLTTSKEYENYTTMQIQNVSHNQKRIYMLFTNSLDIQNVL